VGYKSLPSTRFKLVYFLAYTSIWKMESSCSSETSLFQRTTRNHIAEEAVLRKIR
jgi:hypothetical protein